MRNGAPPILAQRGQGSDLDAHEDGRELRGMLHDLGHGLATLSVLLEAARGDASFDDPLLDLVERETARLLAVAHRGAGYAPAVEPVGLRDFLEQVAVPARYAGAAAVVVSPGPEVLVRTDPALLWRIVSNLVGNAVRAAGPAGTVELVVFETPGAGGRDVVLDITDDGPGFDRGPSGAAGLGLDIVRRLLGSCGGRLEIHAGRPRGTRMRVVLPAGVRARGGLRAAPTALGAGGADCA